MQQNNSSQPGGGRKGLQGKGYYIVLSLCILVVGISGYFLVSSVRSQQRSLNEETLSIPLIGEAKPSAGRPNAKVPDVARKPAEEASGPAALPGSDEAVRAVAQTLVVHPINGDTIHPYSMDRLSYNETTADWRVHDGIDISAAAGTPVKSSMAGTVSKVYDDDFLGTTVVVQHEDGTLCQYSNLTAMPTVKVGDVVAAGDVIGAVGTTAIVESAAEPHLHFAVYRDGVSVNPSELLD